MYLKYLKQKLPIAKNSITGIYGQKLNNIDKTEKVKVKRVFLNLENCN